MLNLPNIVNRVHWTEGMLLSPQHFQHADHYFDSQLAHQLKRSSRYFWGISSFRFDEIALASNTLKITSLECVFPDGSIVQFESAEESDNSNGYEEPVSLDLDNLSLEPGAVFSICIGIAKYNKKCASDRDSDLKRYISVNEGLSSNIGEPQNEVDLVTLHPMLRLHVEEKGSPNHSSFPIAKFEKTMDGTYQKLAFTPPLLSATPGYTDKTDDLWEQLSGLIAGARIRAGQLRSLITDRRSEKVFREQQRTRIISLTHHLPVLEALMASEAHPFEIYCKLVEYASDLAVLLDDPVAPLFPKYSHNDLNSSFDPVLSYIEESINSIRLDYAIILFAENEAGDYLCKLPNPDITRSVLLAFQLPASADKALLIEWIKSAYICDSSEYENLSVIRDIGLERKRVKSFDKFSLIEGDNEVLVEVSLPQTPVKELLISGSDKNLDEGKPRAILCFTGQAEQS